ncbi:MAG: nuclear transport factor 2 family protein [Gemmatimonadota bacterium]|nr:nuclear transport factor 2 family protein [Gemmatimonadota bacterium]MDH5196427.1 nuclear transport factor 2 family protein [Gemmatimonadota bacterium]
MTVAVLLMGPCARAAQAAGASAEAEIVALDDAWIDAEVRHDRPALERILDERFLVTFASGRTLDRTALSRGS